MRITLGHNNWGTCVEFGPTQLPVGLGLGLGLRLGLWLGLGLRLGLGLGLGLGLRLELGLWLGLGPNLIDRKLGGPEAPNPTQVLEMGHLTRYYRQSQPPGRKTGGETTAVFVARSEKLALPDKYLLDLPLNGKSSTSMNTCSPLV